jgi:predicted CXXCH cytochrome family protein
MPMTSRENRQLIVHLSLLFSLFFTGTVFAQTKPNTCIDCHTALDGPLQVTAEKWATDVHMTKGFGCVDCHGGDDTQMDDKLAMNRSKGFIGSPKGMAIIQDCGKCHSNATLMKKFNPAQRVDQVSEYFTSVHGQQLKQGDTKVATCVSCHSVHDIRPVKDPRAKVYPLNVADTCGACHSDMQLMAPYHLKPDPKAAYMNSVHYEALVKKGDLSAPTCNKCHGNHGAAPPGVGSVVNVCGQCHSVFADLFDKSPHKAAFAKKKLPSCVLCHSNHEIKKPNDEMLGVAGTALCIRCHKDGDPGFQQARIMRQGIDELRASLEKAEAVLTEAERKGMEVSQPKFDLIEGRQDLTKARTQVHSFNVANVKEFVGAGMKVSEHTEAKGNEALAEYQFRRKGLAVSLIIILAVIVALFLKIREIDRRQDAE